MENKNLTYLWWLGEEMEEKYGLREGYYQAALKLVKSMENEKSLKNKDTFIFPILFLYGHSLELILKELIVKLDSSEKSVSGHNLETLYETFILKLKNFMDIVNDNSFEEKKNELEPVLKEVKELQNSSISYRYLSNYDKKKESKEYYKNLKNEDGDFITEYDYYSLERRMQENYNLLDAVFSYIEDVFDNL